MLLKLLNVENGKRKGNFKKEAKNEQVGTN